MLNIGLVPYTHATRSQFIQSVPSGLIGLCLRRDNLVDKEMRNFALRDNDGNEMGVFTGKQPKQAALKAANRGHTDIKLERGEPRNCISLPGRGSR